MSAPPPTPHEQIRFLQQLQRLLDEGSFVATYKYALLHAIADLCVRLGEDTGAELELSIQDIAERFVELYWSQSIPFIGIEGMGVLHQTTGRQAAVVTRVAEARERYGDSLPAFQRLDPSWPQLRSRVRQVVRTMPLWKLQTIGHEQVEFLYENVGSGTSITLKPGVMFCFRAFYPLITDLVEGTWSHYVRRLNPELLGAAADLRSFMFGTERTSVARHRPVFEELQEGRCFYCDQRLRDDVAVDHFIPWRRYPVDLGHNFVLAHGRCNGRKGDRLAAEEHLERWGSRNAQHGAALGDRFTELGVAHDQGASLRVARWAYGQLHRAGGQVWVRGRELRKLSNGWQRLFGSPSA